MQMIEISTLKNHPRNNEFFDNIVGDKWEDFKKSIIRRGVVEGVVVTQDLIIVSGHQRVRACKELGILEVPCRVTHYKDFDDNTGTPKDDMILEDLICTNIMQRGVGNVNPMKMAKCINELERIYGIQRGNPQLLNNSTIGKTQTTIASDMEMDRSTYLNYKKLNDLIPELQSLIESGSMKATVGYKIWAKMPQEEQEKFFNEIGRDKIKTLTQKATEELINEKKQLEDKNIKLVNEISKQTKLQDEINNLKRELENRPIIEVEKEIIPNDYNNLKNEIKNKDTYYNNLKRDYDIKLNKLQSLEEELKSIKNTSETEKYAKKLQDNALMFCAKVETFFESVAGLAWLSEHINELPKYEKDSYIKAVQLIEDWATAVKMNMKKYI